MLIAFSASVQIDVSSAITGNRICSTPIAKACWVGNHLLIITTIPHFVSRVLSSPSPNYLFLRPVAIIHYPSDPFLTVWFSASNLPLKLSTVYTYIQVHRLINRYKSNLVMPCCRGRSSSHTHIDGAQNEETTDFSGRHCLKR